MGTQITNKCENLGLKPGAVGIILMVYREGYGVSFSWVIECRVKRGLTWTVVDVDHPQILQPGMSMK